MIVERDQTCLHNIPLGVGCEQCDGGPSPVFAGDPKDRLARPYQPPAITWLCGLTMDANGIITRYVRNPATGLLEEYKGSL